MSDNIDELRNMLVTFRVSELQMLLGFAGRNKTGRKTELQQRALELLRVRSHPIQQKIKDLYKTIQQSGALNHIQTISPSTTPTGTPSPNMPQHQGGVPRATVQPYNVDTRQLQTRSQAMYNQNAMYQQHAYPQYAPRGISPNPANIMNSNYPIHPDVEFKRLPFFDIMSELIKPSTLMPQSNARQQEYNFYFHLTPQQATDIAASRDVRHGNRAEYIKQIQMRFCLVETSCKQEDYFPPGLIVKVNNKQCPLPNPVPTNKPGVEPKRPPRPVNITQMIKLSPTTANTINVQWVHDYGRAYAITVALVHKRNSTELLQRMKIRGPKHSDHTRGLIKEKLNEDADSEIATTSLRVSLMCPLGKMRMSNPCRAKTCQHLQSFDALLYLQMNERKPTWNCPVCDKPALYEDLDIDGYFQEVLNNPSLGSETKEIQLHKDGSWSTHTETKKPVVTKVQKVNTLDDSIEIISDDIEVVTPGNATSSTDSQAKEAEPENPTPNKSVVDLTISDSDDDEPLAKRRAINPKPDSTIKFSDTTSISSSSNQSRVTVTPGPSSVSSSGYPVSPGGVITLVDSPSPPTSPAPTAVQPTTSQPSSCMMSNGSTQPPMFSPNAMPFLDLENEASSGPSTTKVNKKAPLVFVSSGDWVSITKILEAESIKFIGKCINGKIRIHTKSFTDFQRIIATFDKNSVNYQTDGGNTLKVVIRGVPASIPDDKIRVELELKGLPVISVVRMTGRDNKKIQLVYVQLERTKAANAVFDLKQLHSFPVKVETKRNTLVSDTRGHSQVRACGKVTRPGMISTRKNKDNSLKVVIKGVPVSIPDEQICAELELKGLPVISVVRMTGRDNKKIKLVYVQLKSTEAANAVFDLKQLLSFPVRVETKRHTTLSDSLGRSQARGPACGKTKRLGVDTTRQNISKKKISRSRMANKENIPTNAEVETSQAVSQEMVYALAGMIGSVITANDQAAQEAAVWGSIPSLLDAVRHN